jgi:surface polysaccharide O-acyltransferase-like enzyme
MQGSALVVLHLLLLGWALARARTPVQRLALSGVVLAVVMTFSWNHSRDGLTAAFVLLLLWVPLTKVPSPLVPVLQVLAASSLYVYVMHWQALEVLREPPLAALALSFAAGIAYWWLWTRPMTRGWRRLAAAVRGS